jgi:CDGSH-type Zn-finger protein
VPEIACDNIIRLGLNLKGEHTQPMSDQNDTVIECRNNGPLRVMGDNIIIKDQAGNTFGLAGRKVVSLCRCGQSNNKPFCDGSHNHHGFQSECQARDLPPPAPKP